MVISIIIPILLSLPLSLSGIGRSLNIITYQKQEYLEGVTLQYE